MSETSKMGRPDMTVLRDVSGNSSRLIIVAWFSLVEGLVGR